MVNFAIRNTRLGRSVTIDQCLNIGVCVRVCMCVCMCVCVCAWKSNNDFFRLGCYNSCLGVAILVCISLSCRLYTLQKCAQHILKKNWVFFCARKKKNC